MTRSVRSSDGESSIDNSAPMSSDSVMFEFSDISSGESAFIWDRGDGTSASLSASSSPLRECPASCSTLPNSSLSSSVGTCEERTDTVSGNGYPDAIQNQHTEQPFAESMMGAAHAGMSVMLDSLTGYRDFFPASIVGEELSAAAQQDVFHAQAQAQARGGAGRQPAAPPRAHVGELRKSVEPNLSCEGEETQVRTPQTEAEYSFFSNVELLATEGAVLTEQPTWYKKSASVGYGILTSLSSLYLPQVGGGQQLEVCGPNGQAGANAGRSRRNGTSQSSTTSRVASDVSGGNGVAPGGIWAGIEGLLNSAGAGGGTGGTSSNEDELGNRILVFSLKDLPMGEVFLTPTGHTLQRSSPDVALFDGRWAIEIKNGERREEGSAEWSDDEENEQGDDFDGTGERANTDEEVGPGAGGKSHSLLPFSIVDDDFECSPELHSGESEELTSSSSFCLGDFEIMGEGEGETVIVCNVGHEKMKSKKKDKRSSGELEGKSQEVRQSVRVEERVSARKLSSRSIQEVEEESMNASEERERTQAQLEQKPLSSSTSSSNHTRSNSSGNATCAPSLTMRPLNPLRNATGRSKRKLLVQMYMKDPRTELLEGERIRGLSDAVFIQCQGGDWRRATLIVTNYKVCVLPLIPQVKVGGGGGGEEGGAGRGSESCSVEEESKRKSRKKTFMCSKTGREVEEVVDLGSSTSAICLTAIDFVRKSAHTFPILVGSTTYTIDTIHIVGKDTRSIRFGSPVLQEESEKRARECVAGNGGAGGKSLLEGRREGHYYHAPNCSHAAVPHHLRPHTAPSTLTKTPPNIPIGNSSPALSGDSFTLIDNYVRKSSRERPSPVPSPSTKRVDDNHINLHG